MKPLFYYTLLLLVSSLSAQQQLVQPKLAEALDSYIENHDYKINQQGFLIIEVETFNGDFISRSEMDPSKIALNYELKEFKLVIHPEYDSRYLSVNPPLNFLRYKNHLIFLYNGAERLTAKSMSKEFFKKHKRFFMDLNNAGYYSSLTYYTKVIYDGSDFNVQDSILRYKSKFIFPE